MTKCDWCPGEDGRHARDCARAGEDSSNLVGLPTRREAEAAALRAGTHEPAVDDFGNQYLAPRTVRGATDR